MSTAAPAWWRDREAARGLAPQVGQVLWTGSDLRALVQRVDARYEALRVAVERTPTTPTDPLGEAWRAAWMRQLEAWREFRDDALGDWIPWGSTASTAQAMDAELSEYRRAFEERTRTRLDVATDQAAGSQGGAGVSLPSIATSSTLLLGAGLVLAFALHIAKSR